MAVYKVHQPAAWKEVVSAPRNADLGHDQRHARSRQPGLVFDCIRFLGHLSFAHSAYSGMSQSYDPSPLALFMRAVVFASRCPVLGYFTTVCPIVHPAQGVVADEVVQYWWCRLVPEFYNT
jgi:hypothetical protein